MNDRLYSISLHDAFRASVREAVAKVEGLDREWFSNPALTGQLEEIANSYSLGVARLDKAGMHGARREEEFDGRDEWNAPRRGKRKWLDVTVPFVGDRESLNIHPSSWPTLPYPVSVGQNSIVIRVPDDANAQREIDSLISRITETLGRLQVEYEQGRPQIIEAVTAAAQRRKDEIDAQNERDSKLSFPVRS